MTRHEISNLTVALASVIASTNKECDAEIAQLRQMVEQLQASLAQHRAVVATTRKLFNVTGATSGSKYGTDSEGSYYRVPAGELGTLLEQLKGCP